MLGALEPRALYVGGNSRNARGKKKLGSHWGGYTNNYIQREALKVVKKFQEKKQVFTQLATSIASDGGVTPILDTSQGDNDTERDGSAIYLDNVQITGYTFSEAQDSANQGSQMLRVLLILDRQPNGTVPTPTDVLEGTGTSSAVNQYVDPQQASERFRVLRDFHLPVDVNRATPFEAYIPLYDTKTEYDSAETGPETNNLFVLTISNIGVGSLETELPRFRWNTKVVYRD